MVPGADDLDDHPWARRTPRLRALEYDFCVRADHEVLGRYLERTFRAFAAAGATAAEDDPPAHVYSLLVTPPPGQCSVWLDGELLHVTEDAGRLVPYLLWHVNRSVVAASSDRFLLVHASAAEHEGVGLVFPAPMESGKTTLVAGLVQRGLRYITDEAAAIDVGSLLLHPFPKALSVDPGSWPVLPGLRPEIEVGAERFVDDQWHVDPDIAIRSGATTLSPCPPAFLIGPTYDPGAVTTLVPVARSEAVLLLARNSFNFHHLGKAGLAVAASVAGRSACYRLTVGNLDEACRLVLGLIAPAAAAPSAAGRDTTG